MPNIYGYLANSTTSVQITILDSNDQKPEFYKCEGLGDCVKADKFTTQVLEHSSALISFDMTVKDADQVRPKERLNNKCGKKNLTMFMSLLLPSLICRCPELNYY